MTISLTNLLRFGAVKVPAADLVIASEHIHGHHTDGEGDCTYNHLPWMGRHQEAVHTEQTGQHGAVELTNNKSTLCKLEALNKSNNNNNNS